MNYFELTEYITSISTIESVDFFIVGYSLLGKPIYGAHVGSYDGKQILMEGAIHAREWITAPLLVDLCRYYSTQEFNGGMYFIFMSNPDGVELVLDGVNNINCEKLKQNLININNGNLDFSQWKANANAVDLNVNFDAQWGKGVQNVKVRGAENYIGPFPFSEPESMALRDFTLLRKPDMTISLHTKGEEIYYRFFQKPTELQRDYTLAKVISIFNGYPIKNISGSVGGYKDWCIEKLKIPALTIEMGKDEFCHPLDGEEALSDIISKNLGITEEVIKGLIKYGY